MFVNEKCVRNSAYVATLRKRSGLGAQLGKEGAEVTMLREDVNYVGLSSEMQCT